MRRVIDWFQALRRGEKRIAPQGARGRVYVKRDGSNPQADDAKRVLVSPKAQCHVVVKRADGTTERCVVPATVEFTDRNQNG